MVGSLAPAFLAAALLASPAGAASVAVEPPPGWSDVTAQSRTPSVLLALKGPETGSFVLTRISAPLSLENRGVARAFLSDVLAGINKRTGLGFKLSGELATAAYGNGLSARYLRADLKGRPRLIVAVMDFGGTPMLATLVSSVPETMLPEILGKLRAVHGSAAGLPAAREAVSLDGQLKFSLPRGLLARALTQNERRQGFVLAVQGFDSELYLMKVADAGTPLREEPQIVRGTVLSVAGVDPSSVAPAKLLNTPAGPQLVYVSARVKDEAGESQFVAGYMPWCYWGYSALVKGPRALELLRETSAALAQGPSALPKLVERTPRVPIGGQSRRAFAVAAFLAILLAAAACAIKMW